jgi:hypothetical protein
MNASLLAALNDAERLLVTETDPAELATLDEDAAIALESRIRRTRDKYTSQYRRAASARVAEKRGRGKARPENKHAAMKAEAFERALSRVSRRVAALAQQSAAALRAERLAAARAARQHPVRPSARSSTRSSARPSARSSTWPAIPGPRRGGPDGPAAPVGDRALRSPASVKQRASTKALGARRQVRRDTRRAAAR